jgi:peroxiredoxin
MKETIQREKLVDIEGVLSTEEPASLSSYLKPEQYTLVWWHPQALSPLACRTCSGPAEPVKLLEQIHAGGCNIVGFTYEKPKDIERYQNDIGIIYPILSVTEKEAREHGVAKVKGETWQNIPHRIAFLVDGTGKIINRYEVNDATVFLRNVLNDITAGPPQSKWESKKPKRFNWKRLFT